MLLCFLFNGFTSFSGCLGYVPKHCLQPSGVRIRKILRDCAGWIGCPEGDLQNRFLATGGCGHSRKTCPNRRFRNIRSERQARMGNFNLSYCVNRFAILLCNRIKLYVSVNLKRFCDFVDTCWVCAQQVPDKAIPRTDFPNDSSSGGYGSQVCQHLMNLFQFK